MPFTAVSILRSCCIPVKRAKVVRARICISGGPPRWMFRHLRNSSIDEERRQIAPVAIDRHTRTRSSRVRSPWRSRVFAIARSSCPRIGRVRPVVLEPCRAVARCPAARCHRSSSSLVCIARLHRSLSSLLVIAPCHRSLSSLLVIAPCHRSLSSLVVESPDVASPGVLSLVLPARCAAQHRAVQHRVVRCRVVRRQVGVAEMSSKSEGACSARRGASSLGTRC
jgi:hypothetical protein